MNRYQIDINEFNKAFETTYGSLTNYLNGIYNNKTKSMLVMYSHPEIVSTFLSQRYGRHAKIRVCFEGIYYHLKQISLSTAEELKTRRFNDNKCAVEAFMLLTGKSGIDMLKEMANVGINNFGVVFNDPIVYTSILENNGFSHVVSPYFALKTKMINIDTWQLMYSEMSIDNVIRENMDKELYICVSNHALYYNNRVLYDTSNTNLSSEVLYYAYKNKPTTDKTGLMSL